MSHSDQVRLLVQIVGGAWLTFYIVALWLTFS